MLDMFGAAQLKFFLIRLNLPFALHKGALSILEGVGSGLESCSCDDCLVGL